jgi:hypothetical protein
MITVAVMGGLGNQMFQYAAAKALAERHGVGVVIDVEPVGRDRKRSYMLDRLQVPERPIARDEDYSAALRAMAAHTALTWRGRAARLMVRLGLGRPPQLPNTYSELHFHFDPNFFNQGPKLRLYGYFQSELYFAPIADTIRRLFQPREPLGPAAEEIARQIAGATLPVSVHVRRGDYLKASVGSVHGILEAGYYARALRLMAGALGADMTLFVFSDDPAAAEAVIATVPGHRTVIVRGDPDRPWEDMALMARCRHHIVANSSFSWWGAWLNPSADKVVIGPRLWFAPEALRRYNLCDLCPPSWILI